MSCHLAHQVPRLAHWQSTTLIYTLQFVAVIASGFHAILATHVLASITSSKLHGRVFIVPTHK